MAHINDTAPRTIYAIIDSDNHTFYIGKTYPHRIRKTYSEHLHGCVRKTREMFDICNTPPPLYILDEGEMSTAVAFRHCVAWTRYFLEQGYSQAFSDILAVYAVDMIPETQRIFDHIRDQPLSEVLAPERMLPPPNNRANREKKSNCTQLSIRFTPAEYNQVKAMAAANNFTSTTAYCRRMAISGRVIKMDLSLISELIGYYRDTKTLLRQILLAIYKTQKYYPADMTNIQKCIDRMDDMLRQVLAMSTRLIQSTSRDSCGEISDD